MNNQQNKALVSLSKAFAKCQKANLVFVGMDWDLLAYDANEYDKCTEKESICNQQYVVEGNQGETVNTHKCYVDSGGW